MRIAYFGGSFDPPHRAHLQVARAASEAFALNRVLLAPTGNQPLKSGPPQANYADRLVMTRLLCADDPHLEVSELDAPHADGSPNYAVDALSSLKDISDPDAQLFALAGADSFLTLPRWRNPQRLLELAEWIVVSRPGFSLDDLSTLNLSPKEQSRIHLLTSVDEPVSATGIRERLRIGVSCGDMLPPKVALYIARMHLYHA